VLSENQVKEHLSLAYIYAVATKARSSFDRPVVDNDSVDVKLTLRNDQDDEALIRSPEIALQVKAHPLPEMPAERIPFFLKKKNYIDLTKRAQTPRLLVVVFLPADESDWFAISDEQLVLRRCGYWLNLTGKEPTQNDSGQTVYLPREQVFDHKALLKLMQMAGGQEDLR
jgi:hypothetical protein